MAAPPPDRASLLEAARRQLESLGLSADALEAMAEAAGVPPPREAAGPARDLVSRAEGALPRLLLLAGVVVPEAEPELGALARSWHALGDGPASEAQAAATLLARAWGGLEAPWAHRWARAVRELRQAKALLEGPLSADPERPALSRRAAEIAALVDTLPARYAAIPGARLIRRLEGWPRLQVATRLIGQGLGRTWRLWPAGLAGAVLALLLLWPVGPAGIPPQPVGAARGPTTAGTSQASPSDAGGLVHTVHSAPPRPPTPPPAPAERARPAPRPRAVQAPASVSAPAAPALSSSDAPSAALAEAQEPATGERAPAGGGGPSGGGSLRHTALADRAPMAFLGVRGLPSLGRADELWVAQTEVTEAQWLALMRIDLTVLTGRQDRPAEHMTWCEALEYANRLSRDERLKPAYEVPRGCERGQRPRWDPDADGYRLPTEAEWEALAGEAPGWGASRRDVVRAMAADASGLYGVAGNAAELVWSAGGVPVARHRACDAHNLPSEAWPESAPLPCRKVLSPDERLLGVGLRLVREPASR